MIWRKVKQNCLIFHFAQTDKMFCAILKCIFCSKRNNSVHLENCCACALCGKQLESDRRVNAVQTLFRGSTYLKFLVDFKSDEYIALQIHMPTNIIWQSAFLIASFLTHSIYSVNINFRATKQMRTLAGLFCIT